MTDTKIVELIESVGTVRRFRMDDGSIIERSGGTASWRNNNPGNLKLEYAGSADEKVNSTRPYHKALDAAQHTYRGVVALDQWGNAVFETPEAGREAQLRLLRNQHGNHTVEQMIRGYSTADYSGATHHDQQVKSIYKTADTAGVNLRGKTIGTMTPAELGALADGISHFEGFRIGQVKTLQGPKLDPHAAPVALLTSPAHPGHAAYLQVLTQVHAAETAHGVAPGGHSQRVAGALLVEMHREGMTRADRVEINRDGTLVRAVQVSPVSDQPGLNLATRAIETRAAVQQSVDTSTAQLARVDAEAISHVQVMPVQMQARVHAH